MSQAGRDRRHLLGEGPDGRAPFLFFGLVLVLSVPFGVIGAITGALLLPGLPVAALQAVCPAIAASILVWYRFGWRGVGAFLRAAFAAWPTARQWPVLLFGPPAVLVVAWVVQRAAGVPVPAPEIDLATVAVLFVVFLASAVAEELGWSSYATAPLRDRWGVVGASLAIGLAWALLHVVALIQADRDLGWILWWVLATVALRAVLVMTFAWTGEGVMGVSLVHASYNVAWQSYPESGSYWDPAVVGPILAAVAVAVLLAVRPRRRRLPAGGS